MPEKPAPGPGTAKNSRARARLTRPKPKGRKPIPRDALRVSGRAVLVDEPVARVEISIDGEFVGRARLGIQQPPSFHLEGAPEAAISGFDLRIPPSAMPPGVDEVTVQAKVIGIHGTELVLEPRRPIPIAPAIAELGFDRLAVARRSSGDSVRPSARLPTDRIRLAAFTHNLHPGGAQRALFEQITRLNRRGDFTCEVVSPHTGPWAKRFRDAGVEVHICGDYPMVDPDAYDELRSELGEWMKGKGFDLVFANTLASFVGMDLAQELGIPNVWMIHESFDLPVWWNMAQKKDSRPELRKVCARTLAQADALMFPAEATRKLFEPYAARERMHVAPCGVEFEELDQFHSEEDRAQVRKDLEIDPDADVVLCLGIFDPRKCQALLARAWALIADRHPRAQLVIVGARDTPYAKALTRYVAEDGLEARCRILEATMEPFNWHLAADVFVLPSDIESAPLALAEAMGFETPVVATNTFGIPEMIRSRDEGLLCEPSDVGELAAKLDEVLSMEPDERRQMALAGSARARKHHDPDRFQGRFEAVLLDLVERRAEAAA